MNETPKTYAQREVQQFGSRKVVVHRLITPEPKPAIEPKKRG